MKKNVLTYTPIVKRNADEDCRGTMMVATIRKEEILRPFYTPAPDTWEINALVAASRIKACQMYEYYYLGIPSGSFYSHTFTPCACV